MTEPFAKELPQAEEWSAEHVLAWLFQEITPAAIASSFGVEDMVLIDMASRLRKPFPVFTLDTDFLFPETYELITRVERRYGIVVERLKSALTPEDQARAHGEALWARDPDRCCYLRKVAPLQIKLGGLRAWVTGIRRDQSPARASAQKIEWDEKFGLVKANPLADWSAKQVWKYIHLWAVPYNPLHDRNYPSIGCTHCTRAVQPGEDPRTGRWANFNKTECGLHKKN